MAIKNRVKNALLICYLLLFAVLLPVNQSLAGTTHKDTVIVGCGDWKPYCYKENGLLQGSLIDNSKAILDAASIDHTYRAFPWARVYHKTLNEANFLLLGLGRTSKREALFKWIVPLKKPARIHAYQLENSKISLATPRDLKDYVIAVERGSYTYDYLIDHGHDETKIIKVSRYGQLFNMVASHRAQLLLMGDSAFKPEAKRNGFDPQLFKRSILVFTVDGYLATSKNTSDEMVKRIQASYAELLKQGKVNLPD